MTSETKRPTAQDIEDFRQVLDGGMRQSLGSDTTTPDHAAVVWQTWVRFTGVLDYAADCLSAEEEAGRVPGVETPEDAGEYPCAGGCGTMLEPPFAPGDTCGVCAAVDQFMAGKQPPTDPESSVRAMSDEEVEVALTERGVGPWKDVLWQYMCRLWSDAWCAITMEGKVWPQIDDSDPFDDVTGDTTTEAGRAECSRRLLVHLLRDEG